MKKRFKRSLALLLAVFMTFGAAPIASVGMLVSAADAAVEEPFVKDNDSLTEIEITGIRWKYNVGSNNVIGFSFYEKNGAGQPNKSKVAAYYYKPTELGDKNAEYKYETIPANDSALEMLNVSVSSSDTRVVQFDDKFGRLIPVGNGDAKITVRAVTPNGKVFEDTIIARVSNSPYTPITKIEFAYIADQDSNSIKFDSTNNKITMSLTDTLVLVPCSVTPAPGYDTAAQTAADGDKSQVGDPLTITMDDGSERVLANPFVLSWSSDDDRIVKMNVDGRLTPVKRGSTVVRLTVDDNGTEIVEEIKVTVDMPWWQILIDIIICIFTFRWDEIGKYLRG